ncbi:hypothetical protein E4T47_04200 [Aureobasidium subglaciale]|nr:hypothetical protein E4T43_05748 [Aureobasidium subglaciale]KAI5272528.1 hypothetical protein E4T47_04200 [Aureobasidium subglaciale]
MKPYHDSGLATWLTLLLLPLQINAQRGRELDFTLRFFETSQEDTCSYANSSNALTFTTRDVPRVNHCFNLVDLFDGNATEGFVNQTRNSYAPVEGIRWNVQNSEMFNPEANYSSILYRQYQLHQSDNKDLEPGHTARRGISIYPGQNCRDLAPDGEVKKWYGFSCWSESEGGCGTTPYSIASFLLYPGPDSSEDDKECVEFSQSGLLSAATGLRSPWTGYHVLVTVAMAACMVM